MMDQLKKVVSNAMSLPNADELTLQERWKQKTEVPLLILSLVFLVLYATTCLSRRGSLMVTIADAGLLISWLLFAFDFLVRLALARHKFFWFRKHLFEALLVALPFFQPLRALQVVPSLLAFTRVSATNMRVTVTRYALGASALLVIIASLTVYDAEAHLPDAQIDSFPMAIWWAMVTVTTVGYGDVTPVTWTGRMAGIVLMFGGVALVGVLTATVSAWFVEKISDNDKPLFDDDPDRHCPPAPREDSTSNGSVETGSEATESGRDPQRKAASGFSGADDAEQPANQPTERSAAQPAAQSDDVVVSADTVRELHFEIQHLRQELRSLRNEIQSSQD